MGPLGLQPNIDHKNTQWPPASKADIAAVLQSAINQTRNLGDLAPANLHRLAPDSHHPFEVDVPAYGVRVQISYRKMPTRRKLQVVQFFPLSNIPPSAGGKTLAVEHFSRSEMEALQKAFNRVPAPPAPAVVPPVQPT